MLFTLSTTVSTLSSPKGPSDPREHYLGLLYPSEQYKVYLYHPSLSLSLSLSFSLSAISLSLNLRIIITVLVCFGGPQTFIEW